MIGVRNRTSGVGLKPDLQRTSKSMTGSVAALRNFFAGEQKFIRLPLDNVRDRSQEKISKKFFRGSQISTEAVENFWITHA